MKTLKEVVSRWPLRATLAGVALAVAGTFAVTAWAQHGPGGGMGFGGPGMFGGPERAARMIDHMLDGLDASDAQRTQIKQIAQAAAADLKSQMDAGRTLREKGVQVFTAANVDAAAAEQLRQQVLAQHDQMSRRTLTAVLDMSRVLTPDQRARLGERLKLQGDAMRERGQRMDREQRPHN